MSEGTTWAAKGKQLLLVRESKISLFSAEAMIRFRAMSAVLLLAIDARPDAHLIAPMHPQNETAQMQ